MDATVPLPSLKDLGTLEEFKEIVLSVFAEVTRYPLEILDPDASLEEDLGVDSVKLGEIFSVLKERYDLPEPQNIDIPREKFRTINSISEALYDFLANGGAEMIAAQKEAGTLPESESMEQMIARQLRGDAPEEVSATPVVEDVPVVSTEAVVAQNGNGGSPKPFTEDLATLKAKMMDIFAEVTRYPMEVLDPDANLEEDLGIDSVKLGEIFSVLKESYDLPEPENIDIPREKFRTINSLAEALHEFLSSGRSVEAMKEKHGLTEGLPPEAQNGSAPSSTMAILENGNGHGNGLSNGNGNGNGEHAKPQVNPIIQNSFAALKPEFKPFAGKVAFVSGSGRGLGKNIVSYLAELGATTIVNSFHSRPQGIETAEEIRANGGDAHHIWGSMANEAQLNRVWDEIDERYGKLDFFIHNSSNGMLAPIEKLQWEHWEKGFRTNIAGLQQSAVRAAKLMKKQGGGKIITLSSPAAHGYVEYFGCMGPVKAAVESFTKYMAIEFAPHNIQVNCVSPGPIYGELLKKWPDSQRLVKKWEDATPYHRLCEDRDVSHFIAYLLSQPVELFTGSVLVMDGGISSRGWGGMEAF